MTIDEAIVQVKEIAKEKRNEIYTFGMHCNPKITKDLGMYEQFAEWLEELKKLREGRKEIPIATVTFSKKDLQKMVDEKVKDIELDIQGIRNKAIDDFFDELQNYEDSDNWLRLKMSSIYQIAEQLKEGSADNE